MNTNLLDLIDRFSQLKVLVIGEAILDCYLRGKSDRLCQEAPVPVVNVTDKIYAPGGSANTAVNVHRLGSQVMFLSVIGNDIYGNHLRQALESCSVSTKHLVVDPSRQTLCQQRVVANSQLVVRFDQGSTGLIKPEAEIALIGNLVKLFGGCDAVIVCDYGYGILTPQIIKILTELQKYTPHVLVIDSNELRAYRDVGITAVKSNYEEAVQLLGIKKLEAGMGRVEQISSCGQQILDVTRAKVAAVTLDTEGAIIFERDNPPYHSYAQPTLNTQAIGAGDTFISTFTLALAAGAETPTAGLLAAAATAIVVTQAGMTTCDAEALRQSVVSQESGV